MVSCEGDRAADGGQHEQRRGDPLALQGYTGHGGGWSGNTIGPAAREGQRHRADRLPQGGVERGGKPPAEAHRLATGLERSHHRQLTICLQEEASAHGYKREAFVADSHRRYSSPTHFRADAELRGKWVLKGRLLWWTAGGMGRRPAIIRRCLETGEVEWMSCRNERRELPEATGTPSHAGHLPTVGRRCGISGRLGWSSPGYARTSTTWGWATNTGAGEGWPLPDWPAAGGGAGQSCTHAW